MANIELDGANKKIKVDSGDLTLDIPGEIILDADGANVTFKDGGTAILDISNSSSDAVITASVQDKDIIFKGDDGGSAITALTLDMSDAGKATFNDGIVANNTLLLSGTTPAIAIDENLQITTGGDIVMGGATPTLTIGDAGAEDTKIVFDGNAQDFHIGLDDTDDDFKIGLGSTLGTTSHIVIDEAGHVTMPLQSCFSAYYNGAQSNKTGDDTMYTVLFDTERFDLNGDFASNTFTAPVTGKYLLSAHIGLNGFTSSSTYSNVYLVTSNDTYAEFAGTEVENNQMFSFSIVVDMDASDTAYIRCNAGGEGSKVVDVANGGDGLCFFSGCLLA